MEMTASKIFPFDADFAYLDVETTGLDPYSGDRICEIAILKTKGDREVGRIETLINPGRAIPVRAASINGITDQMVRKAPFFRDMAKKIQELLQGSIIVAHNARFDIGFLQLEFDTLKLTPIENRFIDTLAISKRYYNFPSNNLGDIARSLGISAAYEHRAFADVRIMKGIFEYFLMDLSRRGIRIKKLKDILKLQGPPQELRMPRERVIPREIEEALRSKGRLQITYLSAYSDSTTTRVIEPIEVSLSRSNTYVLAYCHLRKERCSFRLDRILEIKNIS